LEFLEFSFDLRFGFYKCIDPYTDACRGSIALCRNDGDCRFLYFLDVGIADVLVGGDEHSLLCMAMPNDTWVFDTILRPLPVHSEYVGKALNIKAGVLQLLRVDVCAEGVLKKQNALVTLLYVAQGASTRR